MDRASGTSWRIHVISRKRVLIFLCCTFFFLPVRTVWMQENSTQEELVQEMIQLVLKNNPTLESVDKLVVESQKLHVPNPYFSLDGLSFSLNSAVWDDDLQQFQFNPTFGIGASISLFDPDKARSSFAARKEKEVILQDMHITKNAIISDLITRVREIAKLENQKASLGELRIFLESQSASIIEQVSIGTMEPDKLWILKERIMNLNIELRDVENQLKMLRLETAMNLGGDAWSDLHTLLLQVSGSL